MGKRFNTVVGVGLLSAACAGMSTWSNADPTAHPVHPHFQFLRSPFCDTARFDRCLGPLRWPAAWNVMSAKKDSVIGSELAATGREDIQAVTKVAGTVVRVVKNQLPNSTAKPEADPTTSAAVQPATKKELQAAAKVLKAKGVICPTGQYEQYTRFIQPPEGEKQDPDAYFCLDTSTSDWTQAYGKGLVSAVIEINPAYTAISNPDLSGSFDDLKYADCQKMTLPVRQMGTAALRATGKISPDHTAEIDLVVAGAGQDKYNYKPVCSTKPSDDTSKGPN